MVIKKQSKLIYTYNLMPEPLDLLTIFNATHRKKPILSSTIVIIMVDNIVNAGPLTISIIPKTSFQETIPAIKTIAAPIDVGIASFIPYGLQSINIIVSVKTMIIMVILGSSMNITNIFLYND